ncbi:hypothetical protein [Selenomonas noxia]|uniref:hypothetical protein n=1 Tax=Selenomonas noxia TaxID=135083 RepID=UPI00248AE749|nr:hypothetical protein [Selenomonas noxia]
MHLFLCETIGIRENPTQDISALSRNTENALNELGRIFDKKKIEEQQELAAVFGEEAFRLAHNLKDDGSGRKIAVHAIIDGIMSQITGAGFSSGAVGAGLNEALIKNLKGKDPGTAQTVSAIIGAAAKVAGDWKKATCPMLPERISKENLHVIVSTGRRRMITG